MKLQVVLPLERGPEAVNLGVFQLEQGLDTLNKDLRASYRVEGFWFEAGDLQQGFAMVAEGIRRVLKRFTLWQPPEERNQA